MPGAVPEILIGFRPDGSAGLDIAKPGVDVLAHDSLLEPNLFSFSSKWDRAERVWWAGVRSGDFDELDGGVSLNVSSLPYAPIVEYHRLSDSNSAVYMDQGWHEYNYDLGAKNSWSSLCYGGFFKSGSSLVFVVRRLSDGKYKESWDNNHRVAIVVWEYPLIPGA